LRIKMKLQSLFCVTIIVELCLISQIDCKRGGFGITSRRKNAKTPSVRRGQHGHGGEDHALPPVAPPPKPKPAPAGWNVNQNHQQGAMGPPPAYPGMGHHSVPNSHGAPPAYSPYSPQMNQPKPGVFNSPGNFHQPQQGYNQFGGSPMQNQGMMGGGMMGGGMMGGGGGMMPMMGNPYGYNNNRGSSGIGTSLLTAGISGFAGYQMAKVFSGGSGHRDREIHYHDNRQVTNINSNANSTDQVLKPEIAAAHEEDRAPMPAAVTEIPTASVTQMVAANNAYNHYGIAAYGVPFYGYNVQEQPTEYYQTSTFRKSLESSTDQHQLPSDTTLSSEELAASAR